MQVLANTYITRIKNYVKFLQKKEGKKTVNDSESILLTNVANILHFN